MRINNIQGLIAYVKDNLAWQTATIRNVIRALGYTAAGGRDSLKDLSGQLVNVARNSADCGFPGFIYFADTIRFFRRNREDIIHNIEQRAADTGEDVIKMVQSFGVFRNSTPPAAGQVGRALWDSRCYDDLSGLYNAFAWYALEEVAHIWCGYLEDNPRRQAELSA